MSVMLWATEESVEGNKYGDGKPREACKTNINDLLSLNIAN